MSISNAGGRTLPLEMTADENEQAEQCADRLDAAHAAHVAAGNPPRTIDPGLSIAKAFERGDIVPVDPPATP